MTSFARRLAIALIACAAMPALTPAQAQIAIPGTTGSVPVDPVVTRQEPSRQADINRPDDTRKTVLREQRRIVVGSAGELTLPADARDIIVTNPTVVQAMVRGQRKLVLVGLADGATDVTAINHAGDTIAVVKVTVSRDLATLSQILKTVLPTSTITIQAVGSTVVLTGTVDNITQADQAVAIASRFVASADAAATAATTAAAGLPTPSASNDTSNVINGLTLRDKDQVMLRVTVAEIQRSVIKQLGISTTGTWQIDPNVILGAAQSAAFPVNGSFLGGANGVSVDSTAGSGALRGRINLQALEQAGVARVLAEPNLTAISGERAEFRVGGQVPIPTGAAQAQGTANNISPQPTIEFKDFGVSLSFTPVVLDRGRISLNVGTEVSEVDPTNGTTIPTSGNREINIPGFRVRRQATTIELASGASLVTAGLIQQTTREAIRGVPGLMNMPILGTLFRSRDYQRQETELLIIVTPYIAKSSPAGRLPTPVANLRDASDPTANFLGQINKTDAADPLALAPRQAAPKAARSPVAASVDQRAPKTRPAPRPRASSGFIIE